MAKDYSITFGGGNDKRNTWTNWQLIPESPPVVPRPKPKTNYLEIPGRVRGPLDMTTVPFGRQTYERITGSWSFALRDDYWYAPNRKAMENEICGWLNGRYTRVCLEEDPSHLFYGRFTVDPPSGGKGPFVFVINFDLEPVRYNLDNSADRSWLPDVSSWIDTGDLPDGIRSITDAEIRALFGR